MTSISKQLLINKLCLQHDIIEVIQEYIFYNIIEKIKQTKTNKNKIINLIKDTEWSPIKFPFLGASSWLFWINDSDNSIQFQNDFCLDCGDYLLTYTPNQDIRCKCLNV
jgi:hypothetical protein